MVNTFTDYEDGQYILGLNGKTFVWQNEDNRGKTSILLEEGDIWVVPTNNGYYKIMLRLDKKDVKEVRCYSMGDEEKMWVNIEREVDRMLTDLGY